MPREMPKTKNLNQITATPLCKYKTQVDEVPSSMAILAVLLFLMLVLQFASQHSSRKGTHDAMSTHLIAAKVSRGASTERTHQTAIALLLGIRICGAIVLLLAGLPVWVLGLVLVGGILVLRVGTLLGELLGWWLAGVLLLVVLAVGEESQSRCFETWDVRAQLATYPCCWYGSLYGGF
jgi:peptidoglycan/LPS O-acetylase OafA/YrhL